jgi:multidrug efflux pump subunit AcrB
MIKTIARISVERPLYAWIVILFALIGGAFGYVNVGKLEDPLFTLKSALVVTPYPGATAAEVALEVSEPLESEIQQMGEVDHITSRNAPGVSVIEVEIGDTYDGGDLPQIWDDLRDRVENARPLMPAGALPSSVNDDFSDVFGIYYAVSAPGYSDADVWEIASFLRREVLAVDGVSNAQLLGLPEEAIFVDLDNQLVSNLGVPPGAVLDAIASATAIVPTGTADQPGRSLIIDAPRGDDSVEDIVGISLGVDGEIVNLTDFAELSRGRIDDPSHIVRHDGVEAFTLGIAGLTSRNIVEVGHAVEARLDAVASQLPVGVEIEPIYEQHRVVDEAAGEFLGSLALSVGIVIGVLMLFMGWRAAVVVGASLLLTVMATFLAMYLFDIKVERISLGALIIAMGMLVDNAIVVAEGMQQKMRAGTSAADAAEDAAGRTGLPLLGATVIGVMAFAGIGLSPDSSGEFLFSLFAVIGLSLMLSWVFAVSVTPLLGRYLFRTGGLAEGEDPYGGAVFRAYRGIVRLALRVRWLVIAALLGVTVASFALMSQVTQQFFPPASTPIFYLEYKAAQGGSIHRTSEDLRVVEDWLLARDDVASVTASAGRGLTRFLLTYEPESPEPSYGELVIRTPEVEMIPALRRDLDRFVAEALPWATVTTKRIIYGPTVPADIEARFSGPDPDVLRALAEQAQAVLRTATPDLHTETIDWHEREPTVRPIFATDRAQAIGISRADIATGVALVTDGIPAGVLRERDRQIDIVVRSDAAALDAPGALVDQPVWSPATGSYVPLAQAIDGFEVTPRDTLQWRRDREPTITVQANVIEGLTPPTVFAEVRPLIEAIALPDGYALEWGGEFESAGQAQASLGRQMPISFGTMLLITVLLFGALRQTAVIWTIVPMAVNGAALGLYFTGLPFSFTALLGLLSLSGMLIKNAIVLVEEIDLQKAEGAPQSRAIVEASTSRLRPVVLAAATTILGMVPLLADSFFASMAVTIMAGLGFASVLTLIGVPVLYHTYLRAERRAEKRAEGVTAASVDGEAPGGPAVPTVQTGPRPLAAE